MELLLSGKIFSAQPRVCLHQIGLLYLQMYYRVTYDLVDIKIDVRIGTQSVCFNLISELGALSDGGLEPGLSNYRPASVCGLFLSDP